MRMRWRRYFAALGAAAALSAPLVACSSGGGASTTAAVEETTTTEPSTTTTQPPEPCTEKYLFEASARHFADQPVQVLDLSCSSVFAIATLEGEPLTDFDGQAVAIYRLDGRQWQVEKVVPTSADLNAEAPTGLPATLIQSWARTRDARAAVEADEQEAAAVDTEGLPPPTEPPPAEVAPEEAAPEDTPPSDDPGADPVIGQT